MTCSATDTIHHEPVTVFRSPVARVESDQPYMEMKGTYYTKKLHKILNCNKKKIEIFEIYKKVSSCSSVHRLHCKPRRTLIRYIVPVSLIRYIKLWYGSCSSIQIKFSLQDKPTHLIRET